MTEPLSTVDIIDRLDDLIADARALEMAIGGARLIDKGEDRALNRLIDRLSEGIVALHGELDAQHKAQPEQAP
jgi:hypothetical protein